MREVLLLMMFMLVFGFGFYVACRLDDLLGEKKVVWRETQPCLKVAVSNLVCVQRVIEAMKMTKQLYPSARWVLFVVPVEAVMERLRCGEADVAILPGQQSAVPLTFSGWQSAALSSDGREPLPQSQSVFWKSEGCHELAQDFVVALCNLK